MHSRAESVSGRAELECKAGHAPEEPRSVTPSKSRIAERKRVGRVNPSLCSVLVSGLPMQDAAMRAQGAKSNTFLLEAYRAHNAKVDGTWQTT